MKILIFNELYFPYHKGGAEISTQLLAEELAREGNEVHVCTSCDEEREDLINDVYVHRLLQHNVYWSYYNNQSLLKKSLWHIKEIYNLEVKKSIKELIKRIQPDIIHTNVFTGFSVCVWGIAHSMKIPIVHTLRDYYMMCVKSTLFNKNRTCTNQCFACKLTSKVKKHFSHKVDAVIGISYYILDLHIKNGYFNSAKYTKVIPNAVSQPQLSRIKRNDKVIGFLGRIHQSKGIEFLIDSFLQMGEKDYVLQVAGEGDVEYVNTLKKRYPYENIQFIGKVSAMEFLQSISLLVVPSLWDEPFGRVIVEAIACECPVFVSNKGGMPELINDDCGQVFDINNSHSLTDLLCQYVSGRFSFSFSKDFIISYSTTSVAEEYLKIYMACTQSYS